MFSLYSALFGRKGRVSDRSQNDEASTDRRGEVFRYRCILPVKLVAEGEEIRERTRSASEAKIEKRTFYRRHGGFLFHVGGGR